MDLIRLAKRLATVILVLVYQTIMAHLLIVIPSARSTLNALATWLVSMRNVEILVQAVVDSIPTVMYTITFLTAFVTMDTKEIHSEGVIRDLLHRLSFPMNQFVIVVLILNVTMEFVLVCLNTSEIHIEDVDPNVY